MLDNDVVVRITIDDRRYIPIINRQGPITFPFATNARTMEQLKALGYDVNLISVYDPKEHLSYNEEVEDTTAIDTNVGGNVISDEVPTPLEDLVIEEFVEPETKFDSVGEELVNDPTTELEVEVTILTDEEVEKLEAGDLRDYILQFEALLSKQEVHTAQNAQKKRLVELAKLVNKRVA